MTVVEISLTLWFLYQTQCVSCSKSETDVQSSVAYAIQFVFLDSACFMAERMLQNMYSTQWIQSTLCFSGQEQVAQNPECKIKPILNTVKTFRATDFQGKRKLLKILNGKKYIFNTVNTEHTLFYSVSASCSKSWMYKYIQCSEKFQALSDFQGKRKLLKILNLKLGLYWIQ